MAATVTAIDVGVQAVKMRPKQPFRVRVREVVLTIDLRESGLKMIHLDYARSSLEVEDPGGWQVQGPGSLFDVLGTRSGRGSMWVEVDLRFKLDLGPVKVSGATIRATLDDAGKLNGEMRGLDASITLDPMVTGRGAVTFTPAGFRAALQASVLPLGGLGAQADVVVAKDMVKLGIGVDLPGPLPLANSGLAIYGLGGMFAAGGRPAPVPGVDDPIQNALQWDYTRGDAFVPAPGAFSFGLEAVIGTAPDMGFTFSARAGRFVTTPDIVVRGSVEGRYMGPRMKIARGGNELSVLQAKGVVIVDPADGVTIAVEGKYEIPQTAIASVTVRAVGLDLVALKSAEPGLFIGPGDPAAADAFAPGYRLRRASGGVPEALYAREIGRGALQREGDEFIATILDAPTPNGLSAYVRYHYWAEVQMPAERRLPPGVEELPLPAGSVEPIQPAQSLDAPGTYSAVSAPAVAMFVPAEVAALAAEMVTATVRAGAVAGTWRLTLSIAGGPVAHVRAMAPFRVRLHLQVDGGDWTSEPGVTPLTAGAMALVPPIERAAAALPALRLALVLIDPAGRESAALMLDATQA